MTSSAFENRPWLRQYDAGVATSLQYPGQTVPEMYTRSIAAHADRTALAFMGKRLSYAQLGNQARSFATYLKRIGLQPGDRVVMVLPNTPHFPVVYHAIHLCGGVVVPASPLDTAAEVFYKVENSGARLVVFLDLLYEQVKSCEQIPGLLAMVGCDISDYLPFPKNLFFPIRKKFLGRTLPAYGQSADASISILRYRSILKQNAPLSSDEDVALTPDDLAVILYTGGTTGVSKGVMLSHRALVVNVTQGQTWVGFQRDDVILCVLPFFHGFGMSMGMNLGLFSGAECILNPRFDSAVVLKHLAKDKVTMFAGVPTMYIALMSHPDFAKLRGTALRGCFVGAAPVPETLKQKFYERTGGILIEGYGLTETVTANCALPYQGLKKEKSIGIPWPDTEFRIVDVDDPDKELGIDQEGELLVRTPAMMMGYWENPEATAQTIRNGWLHTGDICSMDADGYFYIVDRKKDLIISGGFNVYPTEIEEVLYMHKHVREACVIGVPDDYKGEVPKAYIVSEPEHNVSESDLQKFLEERLIRYKVPKYFEFREVLPKSPIGKILRKELRKEHEQK
ncbi:MAG: long-chain fatty acid--CoA ligase [Leptospiraceae bacterium]|nr:long-chain fatty acid--CoA ligase [Leptospiraceae bacterium]